MADEAVIETNVSIEELLDAGLHFGHQTKRWNPKMKPYVFGVRNGIHLIDLNKTLEGLRNAQRFLYEIVARGRTILFVGTKKQAQGPVREVAQNLKQAYVTHRWLGGMLTNNQTIRKSVKRMRDIEQLETKGEMARLPKKEVAELRREHAKLHRNLEGVADLTDMPGALFVIDIGREDIAVNEARTLGIPVVAMVDTNCDPRLVDYPIPGNEDATRAIRLILKAIGDTILQASNENALYMAQENRRRAAAEAETKAKAQAREDARRAQEQEARTARAAAAAEERAKAEATAAAVTAENQARAEAAKAAAATAAEATEETAETPEPEKEAETPA
ncbi:MAG: 30S ribosomal protein S2 [Candidatus Marinimicrobia bacterium]|nr:30S ribosomal protein S2 [Candidatus Neomarinimicrobiota bacterium]